MEMIDKKCENCGKIFSVRKILLKFSAHKYCSMKCYTTYKPQVSIKCGVCGKDFLTQPHRLNKGRGIYCSKQCQHKSMKRLVEITCIQCGKVFYKKPNMANIKHCSRKCAGLSMRGRNHPMYVEGKPVKDYGDSWQTQRKLAIQRDGYKCVVCGKTKKQLPKKTLHVHHKIRRRFFTDEIAANDLSNLVTLCIACHRKAEDGRIVL